MGLLDSLSGLMDLNNPQVLNAYRLLSTRQGELGGLLGQFGQEAEQRKARAMQEQLHKQQMEARAMEMEQMRRQQAQQGQMDQLARTSFAPNQNLVNVDDNGEAYPSSGGGGLPAYAQGMMQIDPMKGIGLQAQLAAMQQKNYQKLGEGESLFDMSNPSKPIAQGAAKPNTPFAKINPADYTPDSFRKFAASKNYEDLVPYRKPDAPERPAPQQHVMVGDVAYSFNPRTGQYAPAVGADGQPIAKSPKDKPLTEAQGTASMYLGMMTDAEKAAGSSGFDPVGGKNQTLLAFARGDIPKLPKVIQNAAAGAPAQKYAQGMYQWTEAMLRATTGATAPETEVWRTTKTFWPMPGDSKEVIAQKADARNKMQDYIRIKSGHGGDQVDAAQSARPDLPDPLGLRK